MRPGHIYKDRRDIGEYQTYYFIIEHNKSGFKVLESTKHRTNFRLDREQLSVISLDFIMKNCLKVTKI